MAAEEIPSAAAGSYYSLHLEDSPEGVYEWPERDLIFVQVRIPYGRNNSPDKLESAELSATRRVLHAWLAQKASKRRVDPILPFGMDMVRSTCRRYLPMLEYSANWSFSGDSCCFSREKGREHIAATVFRSDDVLASIPKAYLDPVADSVWLDGIVRIVRKHYSAEGDLAFMWQIGALDCLDASRPVAAEFPDVSDAAFCDALEKYLDDANATWRDVDSPAKAEYAQVRGELSKYLLSSPAAMQLREAAARLATPAKRFEMSEGLPSLTVVTNTVAAVHTNAVDAANSVSNRFVVSMAEAGGIVRSMPEGNRVTVDSERVDVQTVTEVVTQTIVFTTAKTLRRTEFAYSGNPRFERLFLSGGSLANKSEEATAMGKAAQKVFYGQATMKEREQAVLGALRENPGDKVLWNLYGRIFQSKKDWLGAVVCFRNALRIDREYEFALVNLADTYRSMGKKRLAAGTALLARGLSADKWCVSHSESVLNAKW